MEALILTRDEGEQLTRWDGKRVVRLENESGNYHSLRKASAFMPGI